METGLIYKKMALVLSDIGAVSKDRQNNQQNYKFRGVEDVYNHVNAACKKHGVFCLPRILKIVEREKLQNAKGSIGWHLILEISYKFHAEDGSFVEAVVWGEALDWGDKAVNKCMSIGHKYALFQIFMIPTQDLEDPDASSPYKEMDHKNEKKRPPVKPPQDPDKEEPPRDIEDLRGELIEYVRLKDKDWFAALKREKNELIDKIMIESSLDQMKKMYAFILRRG